MFILLAIFIPMCLSPISYIIGRKNKKIRNWLCFFVSAAALICAFMSDGSISINSVLYLGLTFNASFLQKVLAILAGIIWAGSELFSHDYLAHEKGSNRYHLFSLLTLGATMGVFLSGDLFTLFVFFEIMSFTSYVIVKQTQEEKALMAAQTYLAIAVGCGMMCLIGIFMLYNEIGTLAFDGMFEKAQSANQAKIFASAVLMLIGFGAKAGMFPVHVWLPQTHPAAPAPFSAILSCILTKTGIFGILAVTCKLMRFDHNWGMLVTVLGTITMVLGAVLALLSIDLKRTLACSSLSQIGFVLVGIGTQTLLGAEGMLAMDGTLSHIMNHALIKLVLFTCAGAIFMDRETLDLNKLRGAGRGNIIFMICFLFAAASISGIPLFGGYISKTLLHEGIVEAGLPVVEWLFIISGGFTLAYMTKLFVCLFIEKGEGSPVRITAKTWCVLIPVALVMPVFGILSKQTILNVTMHARGFMGGEGDIVNVSFFAPESLLGAGKSILIGVLVYLVIVRKLLMKKGEYINRLPDKLSIENGIYRPLVIKILPKMGYIAAFMPDKIADAFTAFMKRFIFNNDDGVVMAPEDRYFGRYADEPFLRKGFSDTLAFSFLLLGICVTVSLIYIIACGF